MAVETLGEACSQGWRVIVRCSYARSESPRSQSSRECNYRKELDMETLVWTRGRAFPLSRPGKLLALPALWLALCRRALSAAAPGRRALVQFGRMG
jgi:hypothetical protein